MEASEPGRSGPPESHASTPLDAGEGLTGRVAGRGLSLRPSERVLYEGRPSWRALLSFYASGIVGALVIGALVWLAVSLTTGVIVAAVLVGLTVIVGWVRRLFTTYLITNERLRIARGVLRRRVQETRLDRVQNVNYDQSLFDRIVNVGTVDFDTAGRDDSEFRFEWVNGPEQVIRAVDEAMAERPHAGP
jgi:membrane protein YdbS with pleckstrin-like domain